MFVPLPAKTGSQREMSTNIHAALIDSQSVSSSVSGSDTTAVIEARNLVKQYPGVRAVNDVSFAVPLGTCFGLLGSNGAGKTTTVEMLEGLVAPTSGTISYKGKPLDMHFKQEMGIMFQSTALQDYISVDETLTLFGSLYDRQFPREELIDCCQIRPLMQQRVSHLSGGQKQRLLLAIGLINDPLILFLDEPTTGLDPLIRQQFWQLIESLKKRGTTIILTTHYMDEAYQLCDYLMFIEKGQTIVQGKPADLLEQHYSERIVALPQEDVAGTDISQLVMNQLASFEREGMLHIATTDVDKLLKQLQKKKISLARMVIRSRSLEEFFIDIVRNQQT